MEQWIKELSKLTKDQEIIKYYQEIIDEEGLETYEEICEEIGKPQTIIDLENESITVKDNLKDIKHGFKAKYLFKGIGNVFLSLAVVFPAIVTTFIFGALTFGGFALGVTSIVADMSLLDKMAYFVVGLGIGAMFLALTRLLIALIAVCIRFMANSKAKVKVSKKWYVILALAALGSGLVWNAYLQPSIVNKSKNVAIVEQTQALNNVKSIAIDDANVDVKVVTSQENKVVNKGTKTDIEQKGDSLNIGDKVQGTNAFQKIEQFYSDHKRREVTIYTSQKDLAIELNGVDINLEAKGDTLASLEVNGMQTSINLVDQKLNEIQLNGGQISFNASNSEVNKLEASGMNTDVAWDGKTINYLNVDAASFDLDLKNATVNHFEKNAPGFGLTKDDNSHIEVKDDFENK